MSDEQHQTSEVEETELPNKQGVRVKQKESSHPMKLDFSTYIISLGHTVQVALGKMPNPETNELEVDLTVASQFIDLLEMLEEKTAGNLDTEEEKLISSILYELRLQFVSVKNQDK